MLETLLQNVKCWTYNNIEEPNDVYSAISPLISPCYYLGLAPYAIKNHQINYSKWANLWSLVIIFGNISLILWDVQFDYGEVASQDFKQKLRFYQELAAGILALLGILCIFAFSKKMMAIFPSLAEIDDSMKVLFVWVDHRDAHMKILITLLLTSSFIIFATVWCLLEYMHSIPHVLLQDNLAVLTMKLLIPYYITIIMEIQYCHYLNLVKLRFKLLNDYLSTLIHEEETSGNNGWTKDVISTVSESDHIKLAKKISNALDPVFIVDQIAALHIKLTDTAHIINRTYAIQQLFKVAVTFVSTVSALYFVAIHFSKAESGRLDLFFVLWALSNALEVLGVVHVTSYTCDEANTCPRILHKIRNNSDNELLQETIEIYSLQMYHNRLTFTVLGLFPLDYTLLYTMVAGITTYLVILIQFNPKDFSAETNVGHINYKNATLKI